MRAAIDFGTTLTKVVVMNKNKVQKKKLFKDSSLILVKKFLRDDLPKISTLHYTRSNRKTMEGAFLGVEVKQEDELKALVRGARYLSRKKTGLVVSLGTGTAIMVDGKHAGGTPIGGGMIQGLCELLTGTSDLHEISNLARQGNIQKTATLIKNIYPKGIGGLHPNDIASYFSRVSYPNRGDIALAIITVVGETLGMIVGMTAKAHRARNVVMVGNVSKIKQVTSLIEKRARRIAGKSVTFTVPKNAEYAVAIGCMV
ncbi:MAG: hypothetical protein GXP63_02210 [DPANN group archaeon]|nr:hypothetical protein [DPANN group archaeon]